MNETTCIFVCSRLSLYEDLFNIGLLMFTISFFRSMGEQSLSNNVREGRVSMSRLYKVGTTNCVDKSLYSLVKGQGPEPEPCLGLSLYCKLIPRLS